MHKTWSCRAAVRVRATRRPPPGLIYFRALSRLLSSVALLILNPGLLISSAAFMLPEEAYPCGEQPAGNKSANANEKTFPRHQCNDAGADSAPRDRITGNDKDKMQGANKKEPAEPAGVSAQELAMGTNGFAQAFVMKSKRGLNRGERNDEKGQGQTLERQIIKNIGDAHEIREQQRNSHEQRAHHHDDSGPFQNKGETTDGKPKKFAFLKTE